MQPRNKRTARWALAILAGPLLVLGLAAPAQAAIAVPFAASNSRWMPTKPIVVSASDSYGVGEGAGNYRPGSDTPTDQCHRSYQSEVDLVSLMKPMNLTVVGCSGATTANIYAIGQNGEPPQVAQFPANPQLVYITIGGNDGGEQGAGFPTVFGCMVTTNCEATPTPSAEMAFLTTQLAARLDTAYAAVRIAAPHAKVVVTKYPTLFPKVGSPVGPNCPWANAAEIAAGNQFQTLLNDNITAAAHRAGFTVADPTPFFIGQDICSAHSAFYLVGDGPQARWAHPNAVGRAEIAFADYLAAP
jgi:lysophospholipase L1-like esterase